MTTVAVFCGWQREQDVPAAFAVGRALGDAGLDLVYGGGGVGAMGGIAAGFRAAGRRVTAITRTDWEQEYPSPDADTVITRDTVSERNSLLYEFGDAYLVLPGGRGTLRELLDVWDAKANGEHTLPIIVFGPLSHWGPLMMQFQSLIGEGYCPPGELDHICRTEDLDEAVRMMTVAVVPG